MSAFAYEKSILYWLLVLAWQGLHPLSNSEDEWHWYGEKAVSCTRVS